MGRGSFPRLTLAAVALLLAMAVPALAQLQTGDLFGTVSDEQGQPLTANVTFLHPIPLSGYRPKPGRRRRR